MKYITVQFIFVISFYHLGFVLGVTFIPGPIQYFFKLNSSNLFMLEYQVILLALFVLLFFEYLIEKRLGPSYNHEADNYQHFVPLLASSIIFTLAVTCLAANGFRLNLYGTSLNFSFIISLGTIIFPVLVALSLKNWKRLGKIEKLFQIVSLLSLFFLCIALGKRLEFLVFFSSLFAYFFLMKRSLRMQVAWIAFLVLLLACIAVVRGGGNFSFIQVLSAFVSEFYLASLGLAKISAQGIDYAMREYPTILTGFLTFFPESISQKSEIYRTLSDISASINPYGAVAPLLELLIVSEGLLVNLFINTLYYHLILLLLLIVYRNILFKIGFRYEFINIFIFFSCVLNLRNGYVLSSKLLLQYIVFAFILGCVITMSSRIYINRRGV